MELGHAIAIFLASAVWFLSAAKTHGRQVRLERELRGVEEVDFRREIQNHPWVEDLWRRDRVAYWTRAAILFVPLVPAFYFVFRFTWVEAFVLAILFSMSIAFFLQAIASHLRLRKDLRSEHLEAAIGPTPRFGDADWKREARRGTLLWFTLTVLFMAASFASLTLPIMR